MAAANWLKYAYLACFSKPRAERQLYRLVKVGRVCRIVELGIGRLERTLSLIAVAQRYAEEGKVCYTALDWFDARPEELPRLTLKQSHSALQASGAQVRLVPGDPGRSMKSIANDHQHTGLVLISATVSDDQLSPAWFYVPRMLDGDSFVLREQLDGAGEPTFAAIPRVEIAERAGTTPVRRAA